MSSAWRCTSPPARRRRRPTRRRAARGRHPGARAAGRPSSAEALLRRALGRAARPRRSRAAVLLALGEVLTVAGDREAAAISRRRPAPAPTRSCARARWRRAAGGGRSCRRRRSRPRRGRRVIAALPAGAQDLGSAPRPSGSRSPRAPRRRWPGRSRAPSGSGSSPTDRTKHPDVFAHVGALADARRGQPRRRMRAVRAARDGGCRGRRAYRAIPPSLWFPFTTSVLQAAERLAEARASAEAMQAAAAQGSPTWSGS